MTLDPLLPPPANDQIEITVLGKGWGECVVIHVGMGRWIVVDSFLATPPGRGRRPEPVAAAYLRDVRGVDPRNAIESVTLTHLHADHFGGIDTLYEKCKEDTWFHLPSGPVNWNDDFAEALSTIEKSDTSARHQGLSKVASTWRLARDRKRVKHLDGPRDPLETGAPDNGDIVRALAPLPDLVVESIAAAASDEDPALAMTGQHANFTSIVVWLQIGSARALIGGDMDCDPERGWEAIADLHAGRADEPSAATYLKVPHHASDNREFLACAADWLANPISVVTPHPSGLPNDDMITALQTISKDNAVYQAGRNPVPLTRGSIPRTRSRPVSAIVAVTNRIGTGDWTLTGITDVLGDEPSVSNELESFEVVTQA